MDYFILGAIIFSIITVHAASAIISKDISFIPANSNWQVSNVESAIDDLHNKMKFSNSSDPIIGVFESAFSGSVSNFEIGKYYFCVVNMRGILTELNITGADIIYDNVDNCYLDYRYSSDHIYLKANSSTIDFSYSIREDSALNYGGFGVSCYKFGNQS